MADDFSQEHLGHSRVDTGRLERRGFPEVIYCAGKTPGEVAEVAQVLARENGMVLGTRATPEHYQAMAGLLPGTIYHERARCLTWQPQPPSPLPGRVAVVSAGTSDGAVAGEAAVTLGFFGVETRIFADVGVAGIQRILSVRHEIEACTVIIVVAGMEGALPAVVAGLVSKPIIAVPTSVGYGAAFGGITALLGMMNSCGSGVTVVNIDNGFGAAYAAASIVRLLK